MRREALATAIDRLVCESQHTTRQDIVKRVERVQDLEESSWMTNQVLHRLDVQNTRRGGPSPPQNLMCTKDTAIIASPDMSSRWLFCPLADHGLYVHLIVGLRRSLT